jgi:hypothetical protein
MYAAAKTRLTWTGMQAPRTAAAESAFADCARAADLCDRYYRSPVQAELVRRAARWLQPGLVVKRWMFTSSLGLLIALLGADWARAALKALLPMLQ